MSDEVVVLLNRGDGLFAAPIVHHAGSHVRGVAIGYVDADGARDIVVANWDDSTITVMINTGSGGFTDSSSGAATHAVATAPLDVVLYDLNADSNLDIVVAGAGGSGGGGGVSVLLGDGLGGFAAAVTYGGTATAIAIADVDGDGDPDVVASTFVGADVLLNNGDGSFAAPIYYSTTTSGSASALDVALGDIDGDGDPDMAIAHSTASVAILRNNGSGSFGAPTLYTVGIQPASLVLSDLDGDGAPELVVVDRSISSDYAAVLYNDGGGVYSAPELHHVEPGANEVLIAYLDGDPFPDLVAASSSCFGGCLAFDGVSVLLGDGEGGFLSDRRHSAGVPGMLGDPEPRSVAAADLDGDAAPELIITAPGQARVVALHNNGGGDFEFLQSVGALPGTVGHFSSLVVTDLDDDSDPDIAAALYRLGGFALIETNAGALGASRESIRLPGGRVDDIATGQLNGGTLPDLAILVSGPLGGDAKLAISLNAGALNFPGLLGGALGDPTYYALPDDPRAVALGDIDGDGDADVVIAHGGGIITTLLNNAGSGTFSAASSTSVGGAPTALWLEDLDGDLDLDLAIADPDRDAVLLLLNPGNGIFPAPILIAVGVAPQAIVGADIDGDGDVDLAVANQDLESGNVSLLLNDGSAGFQEEGRYRVGRGLVGASSPPIWAGNAIAAADVDRDGDMDLIIANPGSNDISLLLNRGVSSETASGDLTLGATLDTDSEADGASWADPVETRVTTPVAGFVSIYEGPITMAAPTGWRFIAQQVDIAAPMASVGDPLVLVFRLDASRLPGSIPPGATRIFKSGLLVPGCTGAGVADPDPCVAARSVLGDGDAQIEVRSSSASPWNFGYLRPLSYFVDLGLLGPSGLEMIRFVVPDWRLDLIGDLAEDSDDDNLDEMSAEMGGMEASASSANYGDLKLRVRDTGSSPFKPSHGRIEELTGQLPGLLELSPYQLFGEATVSFDAYFEFEIWGQVLVHNEVAIQLTGTVPHWPPPADISLKAIEPIELLDENGQSSGFQAISLSLLAPPPPLPPPPPVFVALPSLFPSALSGLVLCLLLMGGMASQRFARRID